MTISSWTVALFSIGTLGGAVAQNSIGNINGNTGIITQGQQGNNTIIQGPISRHLDEAGKAEFLRRVPKTRKIVLKYLSTESDGSSLAQEMHEFLTKEHYSVEGPNPAIIPDAPRGISILTFDDKPNRPVEILIGMR